MKRRRKPVEVPAPVPHEANDSPFLLPEQAAKYLHLDVGTLANWRMVPGKGPLFRKHGHRRVVYTQAALDDWSAQQERGSTSEKPKAQEARA